MIKSILALLILFEWAIAASRTSAPSGCLVVGSGGNYSTIGAAVKALSTSSSGSQCIFIRPGTYKEQVLVSSRSAQLTIYGYTEDTSSYSRNEVTITASKSQADGLSNDETGTLRIKANNFKLYNVNVRNAYGKGSQAIALSAYANSGYYGCAFTGFQDTLLANEGTQIYSKCLIQGATDFIFGQRAAAWFENCDIRVVNHSTGYVTGKRMLALNTRNNTNILPPTAHGPTSGGTNSAYVFNKCDIAAASGESVKAGTYYLGRPWRQYAHVVFQNTAMSDVINSAGWKVWSNDDQRISDVTFAEYQNTGKGSQGTRAGFSTKLSSAVGMGTILGSGYASKAFYDASYL
jgi:pectinesterase